MYQKKMFNHVMLSIWVIPFGAALLGCLLSIVVWCLNEDYQAFFETYFIHFNGVFVGGSTYLLLVFVFTYKRSVINDINSIFGKHCIENNAYIKSLKFSHDKIIASIFVASITTLGGISLYINGYPLVGFGKLSIMICTFSIYSVAGYGLWSFISIYRLISSVDSCIITDSIIGNCRIEKIILYINISSGMALIALFVAFNGTLTANFTFECFGGSTKYVLLFPIVIFIPFLLYYNYYPHLMLKIMYEQSVHIELNELKKKLSAKFTLDKDSLALEQLIHRHEIYLKDKCNKLTLPKFGNLAVMATAVYMGVNLLVSVYKLQISN